MGATWGFYLMAAVAAVIGLVLWKAGRRRAVRAAQVAGMLWLGYALWEVAVQVFTPDANIRVDLVLFYPLLGLSAVWAVIALLRRRARA